MVTVVGLYLTILLVIFACGSSSSWELRAGRTGPTVIALPRLQTAPKMVRKRVCVGQKLNYRSLPVGPQRGKDDRREYVRRGRTTWGIGSAMWFSYPSYLGPS